MEQPIARCLFCGGEIGGPNHWRHCDGRQGGIEDAEDLPMLISGLEPPTWASSAAAAVSVVPSKDTQRAHVLETITRAPTGATDDEIQIALGIDGSSERPRRWELWKLGQIEIRRDDHGVPVQRMTRTGRRAVVWIAVKG